MTFNDVKRSILVEKKDLISLILDKNCEGVWLQTRNPQLKQIESRVVTNSIDLPSNVRFIFKEDFIGYSYYAKF